MFAALTGGGVQAPAYTVSIIVVLIAHLVLGRQAGLAVTGLNVLAGAAMFYAEQHGWPPGPFYNSLTIWLIQSLLFATTTLMLYLTTHSVSDALHRARQEMADRQQAEAALQQTAEHLHLLNDINHAILAAQSPQAIAESALTFLPKLVPCQRASVSLFNQAITESTLLAVYSSGVPQLKAGMRVALAPIVGETLATGEPHLILDLHTSPSTVSVAPLLRAEGLHTTLLLPLLAEQELIGVLNLSAAQPGALTLGHAALARGVANQLAIALRQLRLLEQAQQQREQVRQVTAQLANAVETERRDLARELHDRVGQSLTALTINLAIIRSQLSVESARRFGPRLDDSIQLVETTMKQVRNVMVELHPSTLSDYGLAAALQTYVAQITQRTGLAIIIQGDELTPRPLASIEAMLFRVAQEAIVNAIKHAHATQLTLTLTQTAATMQLLIADDGLGFDLDAVQRSSTPHWGLRTMQERVEALGGQFHLETAPGQGTRLTATLHR